MEELTHERAMQAAEIYLLRKDYEVMEGYEAEGFAADYVIKDDDGLAFVVVTESHEPYDRSNRRAFEKMAASYLAENSEALDEGEIRLDTVDITAVGEDKVFLRHVKNALGVG